MEDPTAEEALVHAACSKTEALVLLDIERVGVQKELSNPGVANISSSSSSSSAKMSSQALFFLSAVGGCGHAFPLRCAKLVIISLKNDIKLSPYLS
jgi:hypothetical protein